MAGHMEGDIRDSTTKEAILNGATVQHIILVLRKVPGRRGVELTMLLFQCSFLVFSPSRLGWLKSLIWSCCFLVFHTGFLPSGPKC